MQFNINNFISRHITERSESLFAADIAKHAAELTHAIKNKSVLVIGGAGTIGSSYIKAVLQFQPRRLFVVDINENGLTELTRDLRSAADQFVPEDYKTYPINFGDRVFEKILQEEGPFEIVANFAAHKHVRSEKDQYSIEAMIENNVLKAERLLNLLADNPPEHFFCVSTDKAANPVNVMGASKKLMEDVILSYSQSFPITTARFANVAFSNGSLLYGFMERMMKGQPLSSPANVERYFVSPEESGQLCMLACMLGESGDIFFPQLRETQMKNFKNIGLDYLKSLGYEPLICSSEEEARQTAKNRKETDTTYPIYLFGSETSGEKLYEEFYVPGEEVDLATFQSLGVIKNAPKKPRAEIAILFSKLHQLFNRENIAKAEIVELMQQFIPNFDHIETGKSLDQKM